jgi:hypothetical protein
MTQPPSAVAKTGPTLIQRVGVLALGTAMSAWFVARPMYQVLQGLPTIHVNMKMVALSIMVLAMALNIVFLGDKGIPWKKRPDRPATRMQTVTVIVTVIIALAGTGLVWLFFNQHGYHLTF